MTKMAAKTECPGLEFLEVAFKLFGITLPTPDKVTKGESWSDHTKVGPTGKVRVGAQSFPIDSFSLMMCYCAFAIFFFM